MYTFQDLEKLEGDETLRIDFVKSAIHEHINSQEYKTAEKATAYYRHENPDIAVVEKVIYDVRGMAHKDIFTPNHKLANGYYPLIIDMGTSHLLANGIAFEDTKLKEKFGANFDKVIKDIFTDARNCGVSYGFFNGEKLIHFKFLEFKALPDEETGVIRAGIRFTQIDAEKPLIAVLYEADGYTEYIQPKGEEMQLRKGASGKPKGKQKYNGVEYSNDLQGVYEIDSDEKSILPIYPLYNILKQSAIIGNVNILTAIDLIDSQLINNISEGELIYWILQGYGGMDETDDARFLQHILTDHIAHVDTDGQAITPHQVQVQFTANEAGAVRLKRMLFDNMRGVMAEALSAGNLTATAISSAYSAQRLNSGLLEDEVREFMQGILRIMGEDERAKISFSYYETINTSESIANVIQSAQFLGEKVTTRLLASLNGVIDDLDDIEADKEEAEMERMQLMALEQGDEAGMLAAQMQSGEAETEEGPEQDDQLAGFGEDVIEMLEGLLEGLDDGE